MLFRSNPAGISCGTTCSVTANHGSTLTLTATPDTGSSFTGWSGGGCSGTGTCTVTVEAAKSVTASFTVIVRPTTPGRPAAAPIDRGVTLTWVSPSGAPIGDHTVLIGTRLTGPFTPVSAGTCATHPMADSSCTVTGLTVGTSYYFKVTASNVAGSSPASPVSLRTKVVGAPNAVSVLRCVAVPNSFPFGAVKLLWGSALKNGSVVTRYEYSYKVAGSLAWEAWTSSLMSRSLTLTGLTKNSAYQIRVRAVNAIGNGPATTCTVTA